MKLGYSIKNLIKLNPTAAHLTNIKDIYEERSYLLYPNIRERDMYVLIKNKASNDDLFCAYFHAILLAIITCALNDEDLVRSILQLIILSLNLHCNVNDSLCNLINFTGSLPKF